MRGAGESAVAALSLAFAPFGGSGLCNANVTRNTEVFRLCHVATFLVAGKLQSACVSRSGFARENVGELLREGSSNINSNSTDTAN